MSKIKPPYKINSFEFKSRGIFLWWWTDKPNKALTQLRKKNVGPKRYNNTIKNKVNIGNKSKKKEKNKNSAIKKIDPGKPKKIKVFTKHMINNLGHKKLIPEISVISRVLKRRLIASTNKNEFVDSNAWLINIQKLDNIKQDWPLITHIVSQCISTTVEYATNFFKSIW